MSGRQSWASADFRCGRCGHTFTATNEDDYVIGLVSHENAHTLIDAMSPDLRAHVIAVLQLEERALTT